ncbi:MAG: type II toxin-antitoxin system VapC family toxin [Spirochaetaceae bacterium]|nr:MAG: type II toxin-antitoxin system VapC family toxin [Spirochaetaceae bacterium]
MRVLLDTNAYTALLSGDTRVADILDRSDAVLMSAVVLGELYDGFRGGSRTDRNREILASFMGKTRSITVPVTDTTAEWFAQLKQTLRKQGTPIPMNDVWIAATCLEHAAALVSYDAHFQTIHGLLVLPESQG